MYIKVIETTSIVSVQGIVTLWTLEVFLSKVSVWWALNAFEIFLLNANRTEWNNWQNIPFLLYYNVKAVQIRIDEILHKMLLK